MAWISCGALPCRGKKTWWQHVSRCCWNCACPWYASEIVSFLVRLRTYMFHRISILREVSAVRDQTPNTKYNVPVSLWFFLWRCGPTLAMTSSFTKFLDDTRRTTVGRNPLDEWSVYRRDLYLTTHNTHNRQTSMPRWDSNPQSQQASGRSPTP